MEPRPSAVIKLGGSLLGLADLPAHLEEYLRDFSRPRPVLIAGGGDAVELLRGYDRLYGIGEEESHWIALRILSVNTRIVARLLPHALAVTSSVGDLPEVWKAGRVPVLDPLRFIQDYDTHTNDPLPRRWRVTSDSIAARIARVLEAPEVILLKSCGFPEGCTYSRAAAEGLVDPHFPVAASGLARVVAVNFRARSEAPALLVEDDPR